MKKERDMFYGMDQLHMNPNMTGMGMNPMMNPNMPNIGMMPNQNMMYDGITNSLEDRMTRLERQMRKIESRLARLENPYPEAVSYEKKEEILYNQSMPNDNKYMM